VRHLEKSVVTDVVEIGAPPPLQAANVNLMPGVSAAHFTLGGGTVTAAVRVMAHPRQPLVLLSASHVFFPPGTAVNQPVESPPDDRAGTFTNQIATVFDGFQLNSGGTGNAFDAALALPGPGRNLSNQIGTVDRITSVTTVDSPALVSLRNGIVIGAGSVSGQFQGRMLLHSVQISVGPFLFRDIVLARYTSMTQNGDSGAPVFQPIGAIGQLELIAMHIGLTTHPSAGIVAAIVPIARVFGIGRWRLAL
jgi:hypothetical protein